MTRWLLSAALHTHCTGIMLSMLTNSQNEPNLVDLLENIKMPSFWNQITI